MTNVLDLRKDSVEVSVEIVRTPAPSLPVPQIPPAKPRSFFRMRYRIVKDSYQGYEAQARAWWSPIWVQLGKNGEFGVNTSCSVEQAEALIRKWVLNRVEKSERRRQGVVKYVEFD